MKALVILLPVFAYAQGLTITPANPVAGPGGSLNITTNRPASFRLWGAGKIDTVRGSTTNYTAPATVPASHVLAGCMVQPNDSVFNTRVDSLPVSPNSGNWTPFIAANGLKVSYKWGVNVVDNSAATVTERFQRTSTLNGSAFPVPAQAQMKREGGAYTKDASSDHHMIVLNKDTCQFYETQQQGISIPGCGQCTAQSGWTYSGTSYALPSGAAGTGSADSAGLPLAALTLHLSEIRAGSVNHALRVTACAECTGPGFIWPAHSGAGLQSGAPPLGARFRLKKTFDITQFPVSAQVVLTALQRYGMILADIGDTGAITAATDITGNTEVMGDLQTIAGAQLNYTDFEAVDESSYLLSSNSSAINPLNGYWAPIAQALLIATDLANPGNSVEVPIALQPVTAGAAEPALTVQAGTPGFQINAWIRGSATQDLTWAISPKTGAGSVTQAGVYTAPSGIAEVTPAVLTASSASNPSASFRIDLDVLPQGVLRIDTGSASDSLDSTGERWIRDLGFETGNYTAVSDTAGASTWNGLPAGEAWSTYTYTSGDDLTYKVHVPNGVYQVEMMFGIGGCSGALTPPATAGDLAWGPVSLQSQSNIVASGWKLPAVMNGLCRTPVTVTLPAQVTDTALTVAVRPNSSGTQHSAALLNGLMVTPMSGAAPAATPSGSQAAGNGGNTSAAPAGFYLQNYDVQCGAPNYNCRAAFQAAFADMAQAGGGTLFVPAGTFLIDFPDIPQNTIAAQPPSLSSLLVVPPNVTIQGQLTANGAPASVITWRNTSVPTFIFANAGNSGLKNLKAHFIGVTPTYFPFGDVDLLKSLGYHPTFRHQNQMSGGNYEMFSFAYVFNSDNCAFSNLIFDSATQDNNHVFGFGIVLKGKGVIVNNGGGLTSPAISNQIANIQFYDFVDGMLVSGQQGLTINNIVTDRRGSTAVIAPGHVLYMTSADQWDLAGNRVGTTLSSNVTVNGIAEGPDTYSNIVAYGTLAIKYLNGGTVTNITSRHPAGLLQTIDVDQNVTFSNMSWSSNYPLCAVVPSNCSTPVINSTVSDAGLPATKNLIFTNISLQSTGRPVTVALQGDNLQVNGMSIQTPPVGLPGQTVSSAVLGVGYSNGASIQNYVYTPLLSVYNPAQLYNSPFTAWSSSSNVMVQGTIDWPQSLPVPAKGARIITASLWQQPPGSAVTVQVGQ